MKVKLLIPWERVKKQNGILVLTLVWFVLFVVDLISTLRLKELIPYLEANPIYTYMGLTGIAIINVLILLAFFIYYHYSTSIYSRYIILTGLTTMVMVRITAIINNIIVYAHKYTIEVAMTVTTEIKSQAIQQMFMGSLIPYLSLLVVFIFFQLDHNIEIK